MTAPYSAAAQFYRAVRNFAQNQPEWALRIDYETKPDEVWDMTKAAERVYGSRDQWLAIMAAAGLDSIEQPMSIRRLVLPTSDQLAAIQQASGYSPDPFVRTRADAANPLTAR